jgi:hypothetical protein
VIRGVLAAHAIGVVAARARAQFITTIVRPSLVLPASSRSA